MVLDTDSLPFAARTEDICVDCAGRVAVGQMIALRATPAGWRPVHQECA